MAGGVSLEGVDRRGPNGAFPGGGGPNGERPERRGFVADANRSISQAQRNAATNNTATATNVHKPAVIPMAQAWPRTAYDSTSEMPAETVVRPRSQRSE